MKRVELRAAVDPLTGEVVGDPASAGASPADEAALEWALRIAEERGGIAVAVSVGGPECDAMLREAVAAGAERAVRVPVEGDAGDGVPSPVVARALVRAIAWVVVGSVEELASLMAGAAVRQAGAPAGDAEADSAGHPALSNGRDERPVVMVCFGDASMDRGSGSVPAFVAAVLAIPQALGLVGVGLVDSPGAGRPRSGETGPAGVPGRGSDANAVPVLEVERRLDRGRRERLRLTPPFVMSVEAGTARLRRASLQRSLASRTAVVEALPPELFGPEGGVELIGIEAYRPRTRVVPPPPAGLPARGRIAALTGALHERPASRTLVLDPEAAADELLSTLAEWGELPAGFDLADDGRDETEVS
jgi:electron transfer flavoprotein beta subunit